MTINQWPNLLDPLYWAGVPMGVVFGVGGYMHMIKPYPYLTMMQGMPFRSLHPSVVAISGVIEMGVGLGFFIQPSTQLMTGTMLLLAAITPANINMWYNNVPFGDRYFTPQDHVKRGLAQIFFFGWLWALRSVYASRENKGKVH